MLGTKIEKSFPKSKVIESIRIHGIVARLSLEHKGGESINYADTQTRTASGPGAAFDVLGVSHGVPLSDVRRAYLKLAATWHPDKWSSGTEEEIKNAEETFKVIQKAYNDICDSMFL